MQGQSFLSASLSGFAGSLGSHAFDYYKEYRAYTWEYNMGNNMGNNINVNNRLKFYNLSPSAISIVNKNIINLNLSVINP